MEFFIRFLTIFLKKSSSFCEWLLTRRHLTFLCLFLTQILFFDSNRFFCSIENFVNIDIFAFFSVKFWKLFLARSGNIFPPGNAQHHSHSFNVIVDRYSSYRTVAPNDMFFAQLHLFHKVYRTQKSLRVDVESSLLLFFGENRFFDSHKIFAHIFDLFLEKPRKRLHAIFVFWKLPCFSFLFACSWFIWTAIVHVHIDIGTTLA